MTTPKPLAAEELAAYRQLRTQDRWTEDEYVFICACEGNGRLDVTITQAHADLAREKARVDEQQPYFDAFLPNTKAFEDECHRRERIEIERDSFRSQLAEAIKAQRTPGTVEVCERNEVQAYCTPVVTLVGNVAHISCGEDNCPIKAARTGADK